MEIASLVIGVLGLLFAAVTHFRTRNKDRMVRIHLAKMIVVIKTMEAYAGWAVDHYWTVRQALDGEWSDENKRTASNAVQRGSGDAMATSRMAHELLRDLRALQLATFGKAENLTTAGRLLLLTDKNGTREVNPDPGDIKKVVESREGPGKTK